MAIKKRTTALDVLTAIHSLPPAARAAVAEELSGVKGRTLHIRVALAQDRAWRAAAEGAGLDYSEWVRLALDAAAKKGGR